MLIHTCLQPVDNTMVFPKSNDFPKWSRHSLYSHDRHSFWNSYFHIPFFYKTYVNISHFQAYILRSSIKFCNIYHEF